MLITTFISSIQMQLVLLFINTSHKKAFLIIDNNYPTWHGSLAWKKAANHNDGVGGGMLYDNTPAHLLVIFFSIA